MAHLQPRISPEAHGLPRKLRLTDIRGFMPRTEELSGNDIRAFWAKRFAAQGPNHPFWLYTHIPFCPQICSYCQCSTSLKKSDAQLDRYLDWLEGEIEHFSGVAADGAARFQYIGGGTVNILSEPQLARVLGKLNDRFTFADGARRSFEFLPSSLRPETLPLVRSFGFNRLSCGVQSWSPQTLRVVNRDAGGLSDLGQTLETARKLGFDEVNLDLIHGIGSESPKLFAEGLRRVLALRPSTVTIHRVIPTQGNPVFGSVEDELANQRAFEALDQTIGSLLAAEFPNIQWLLRPNSWTLVERDFRESSRFSTWYYSDNERLHIDMLSVGRFAHSNIQGSVFYENRSFADEYDPNEKSYHAFVKAPVIDAAQDVVVDLVGEQRTDLGEVGARHGEEAVSALLPALRQLESEGLATHAGDLWTSRHSDGVFIDAFRPILEAAIREIGGPWESPKHRATEGAITLGTGSQQLLVFLEKVDPERRYFTVLGDEVGVYYRRPHGEGDDISFAAALMEPFLDELRALMASRPDLGPRRLAGELRRRRGGD
jgi:coproporphyrinogen III oxidase-like Fe-S oxidoreductase